MVCMAILAFLAFVVYWYVALGEVVYGSTIAGVLHGVTIMLLNTGYRSIATVLNDWENHRTQQAYDNSLIQKVAPLNGHKLTRTQIFMFEFVNNFVSMFYIAFAKPLINLYTSPDSVFRESRSDE